ncbi:ATP-binding cassette domain-containing protein [Microbacterium indicum]|uniref:ATP-binding cassette domain-containing protein n=1 Tax=Microbacterium indicum TaxID=358100 RepID=UPI00040A88C2|nr:ABC transporter ATP-binding protein [Microbacterium indicum]
MTLLDVSDLRVDLPGTGPVLRGTTLSVAAGEALGVVGESGAGKSVLARTLLGLTQADRAARVSGSLAFDGRDLSRASQREWRQLRGSRMGLVLQDALQSLDPLRTVEAEVAETLALRRVPRAERRERAVSALERAGLPGARELLGRRPGELSGGMRQRALIASAIVGGADLVVADEPTTALDATTAARVLDLLARLRDEGAALVLISHDLHAVRRVADRVAVLDRGEIVEQGPTAAVLAAPAHPRTRALLAAVPSGPKPDPAPPAAAALVTASGVTKSYGRTTAVDDVSLTLGPGETLGVVGESGSGKSTLARLVIGQERPDRGGVALAGAPRIRLIPQDPLGSFDPRFAVERILRLAGGSGGEAPEALLASVGLPREVLARRPRALSGGQRQRVAIARALAASPDVLVCDEPVSALDVTTQAGILDLLAGLQRERGLAMLFISHDLAVVRRISDRVMVMRRGRVVEEGPTESVYANPRTAFARELIAASR